MGANIWRYSTQTSTITQKVSSMVVIEDEGTLKFFDGKKELTLREGFTRLDAIYGSEPQETKRIINRLREKYMKDLTNH